MDNKTHYDDSGRLVLSVAATAAFKNMMLNSGRRAIGVPDYMPVESVRRLAEVIYEESGIDFEVYT